MYFNDSRISLRLRVAHVANNATEQMKSGSCHTSRAGGGLGELYFFSNNGYEDGHEG